MYYCVFYVSTYGYSGNEIPPKIDTVTQFKFCSDDKESLGSFTVRMNELGVKKRKQLTANPPPSYSQNPTVGWTIWDFSDTSTEEEFLNAPKKL